MARPNRGKDFEERFEKDWLESFPPNSTFLIRLKDDTSGYFHESTNPSDFICFVNKKLFLVEAKAHYGTRLNFKTDLRQYDALLSYKDIPDVHPCVVVWFIDYDCVIFAPIQEIEKMVNDGKKSLHVKNCFNYNCINVPAKKLRVFMKCDFAFMEDL